jgi:hypothetical protein
MLASSRLACFRQLNILEARLLAEHPQQLGESAVGVLKSLGYVENRLSTLTESSSPFSQHRSQRAFARGLKTILRFPVGYLKDKSVPQVL